ncbi:F-box protein At3g07870-like [Aegilops tauschii subsp. strangulata]|uniref:F-box protein At3g07870-like n=1 Tax=Aegilops tauschii subsp. strangulata TaxID=200361 RepID=UPI003CC8ACC5
MALIWNVNSTTAYVLGDSYLTSSAMESCRKLWKWERFSYFHESKDVHLVSSCNGLICLCDNKEWTGGAVTVVNPATGDTLPVPPLPVSKLSVRSHGAKIWQEAYNFAYHPTTGKYKVVHVPCKCDPIFVFKTVQVFTLGEKTWRDVPAPANARCKLAVGIVSIDGMTHLVRTGSRRTVVSFDLDAECIVSTTGLPPLPDRRESYQLTAVHGRLGLVTTSQDVWVLENRRRWSHRYNLGHRVPLPQFVYGEHVITWQGRSFYTHQLRSGPLSAGWRQRSKSDNTMVRIGRRDEGMLVAYMNCNNYQMFAYVKTMEPLSVYSTNYSTPSVP